MKTLIIEDEQLTPTYREDVFVARERVNDFKILLGG